MRSMSPISIVVLSLLLAAQAPPQKFTPAAPQDSDLSIRLELVGKMPTATNPTSPVAAGQHLLLIDQSGFVYRWDGSTATEILTPRALPPGIKLLRSEPLLNVAADRSGTKIYALFLSSTVPGKISQRKSPRQPDGWYVLVEYQFDGTVLSNPRPLTALQARTEGHTGGGLTVLDDGSVLVAIGDNGDSYEDGRAHGQQAAVHLGKLVRVTPLDGATSIVALGVRAPQRLSVYSFAGERWLTFVDPGGWVSEELNAVRINDLLEGPSPLNFGWGRHADEKAREGTFYISRVGNSVERISGKEPGFVEPIAEFGRESSERIAISGAVSSETSFVRIKLLFGELIRGRLFAVTEALTENRQVVKRVRVANSDADFFTPQPQNLRQRPNPRFFNFPDGTAGVLLERTGEFFRITEVRE